MKEYQRAKALVVGINKYDQASELTNAVNDAKGMADAFRKLHFYVNDYYDISTDEWDVKFDEFCKDLAQFQVCIFYFAGHGVEMEGKNYLLCVETPSTNKEGTKRHSIDLQTTIDRIKSTGCQTCIYIIDACRNNPFPQGRASYLSVQLAPVFAPKGTLIAYSTSPGEPASDVGVGNHSYYTYALLSHIFELGLPVESFFKKVRATVYNLTNGKKTSWEHTSLIGTFCFNSGRLVQDLNVGDYSISVVKREDWDYSDVKISDIISGFCSTQFSDQREALKEMRELKAKTLDKNQLFMLGRCCMWAAIYNCWNCQEFFKDRANLVLFSSNNENHFLNGALFELYFDEKGTFSSEYVDINMLENVIRHCHDEKLRSSFDYIHNVLLPFANQLLFMPFSEPEITSIDVTFEKEKRQIYIQEEEFLIVKSVRHDFTDLTGQFLKRRRNYVFDTFDKFFKEISAIFSVPEEYLKVNSNFSQLEIKNVSGILLHDAEIEDFSV